MLDVECSEWKMQGRRIHASCAPLPLSYIADIENADLFDPLFMDALATRLAEKLAMPLTGNQSLRQNLNQESTKSFFLRRQPSMRCSAFPMIPTRCWTC